MGSAYCLLLELLSKLLKELEKLKTQMNLGGCMLNKRWLIALFSVVSMVSSISSAYIVPGDDHGRPPVFPGDDRGPIRPDPGNPYEPNPYEPNPYEPGRGEVRRDIWVNRTVMNESFRLLDLAGIGFGYRGWQVMAVEVELNDARFANADLLLRTDGLVDDTQRANARFIQLVPRSGSRIGDDFRSLQLDVRGRVDMRRISVVLSDRGGWNPGPGPRPPRVETVTLNVFRSTYGDERMDLTRYIDMRRFAGAVVESVVINARADGRAALIDVLASGRTQGTLSLDAYSRDYTLDLMSRPRLDSFNSIELYTRGRLTVNTVTLRLLRGR